MPQIMGFDRKIKLNWLEQTAWRASTTDDIKEIRSSIEEYLEKEIKGPWPNAKPLPFCSESGYLCREHEDMQNGSRCCQTASCRKESYHTGE